MSGKKGFIGRKMVLRSESTACEATYTEKQKKQKTVEFPTCDLCCNKLFPPLQIICKEAHDYNICSHCVESLFARKMPCPSCRGPLLNEPIRNLMAEKYVSYSLEQVECPFQCGEYVSYDKITDHYDICTKCWKYEFDNIKFQNRFLCWEYLKNHAIVCVINGSFTKSNTKPKEICEQMAR